MYKDLRSAMERSIFISIPILFIISGPMHFLFDITGRITVIGAFVPVNESPWEHLKLVFFPILVWWIIYYFKNRKFSGFFRKRWIVSTAVAVVSAPLVTIMLFYSYTGAFDIELLFIDILSVPLAIAAGQYLALHIYKYSNPSKFAVYISFIIIITLVLTFISFTFSPPHIHLFRDKNTGGFGML